MGTKYLKLSYTFCGFSLLILTHFVVLACSSVRGNFFLQSVYSEQKVNALAASFVRSPVGEKVDWRLSATISPCHVTVIT